MCLIIVKSFIELAETIRGKDEVKYILSEKFSSDSLEEEFAKHRGVGGTYENPTLSQVQKQEVALNAMDSSFITGLTGNTTGCKIDREPLLIDGHLLC